MKMITSYLQDRELINETDGNLCTMKVTSRAAQASMIAPEPWNISYDELLKIDMPPDTYLVEYADDIIYNIILARTLEIE